MEESGETVMRLYDRNLFSILAFKIKSQML